MTEKFNAANTSFLLGKSDRRKIFLNNLYILSNTLLDPNILSSVNEDSSEYNDEKLAEKEGDEENIFRLLKTEEGNKHLFLMKKVLLDEYDGNIDNLKEAFKSTDNSSNASSKVAPKVEQAVDETEGAIDNSVAEVKPVPGKEAEENNEGIQFIITKMDDKNDSIKPLVNSIKVNENGKTIIKKLSIEDIMSYTSSDGNTKRYINIVGLSDRDIVYEIFNYSESEQEWKWVSRISIIQKVANPTRILSNHSDNKFKTGVEWNEFTNLKKEKITKKQAEENAKAAHVEAAAAPVKAVNKAEQENNNMEELKKIKKRGQEAAKNRDNSLGAKEQESREKTNKRRLKKLEGSQDDGSGSKDVNKSTTREIARTNSLPKFGGSRKKNKTKKTRKSRKNRL